MNNNDKQFSETEDTKLKEFLTGTRVYAMLAAAIVCAIVFIPTLAAILGIYTNVNRAENVVSLSEAVTMSDLHGVYVTGSAYKFLTRVGYIAETEAAATEYYYLLYLDSPDGQQIATLAKADKRGDADIETVIDAYLAYVQDPDAGYMGRIVELEGRFSTLTDDEEEMLTKTINNYSISSPCLGYTLTIKPLPKASDTVPYWFVAVPFFVGMVVTAVLFVYGLILEAKREKANESPYPYQNMLRKKNKNKK